MKKTVNLSLDIETYSDVDLAKCGVYRYAESPAFEVLLIGFAIDDGPVQVIDLARGEQPPAALLTLLTDDSVIKWAYNAAFERVCLSHWLRKFYPEFFRGYSAPGMPDCRYLSPAAWRCSMVWGAYLGLPQSLKGIGEVLRLEQQKLTAGTELIRYFCRPCKPTKRSGFRTRNLPAHDPEKWAAFVSYNRRDVEVERGIRQRLQLHKYPVPEFLWEEYRLDQEINDRGIRIDRQLVSSAIAMDARVRGQLAAELQDLTGLENPNSPAQLKRWLSDRGLVTESLDKKAVASLLQTAPEDLRQVLSLRQQLAKSSVAKYQAMENVVCADGRARGMFRFYGAGRTGRWAGRLVQLQNLPQNHMEDLAEARALVLQGDSSALQARSLSIPDTLSQLIRTAFIPAPGYRFCVADFSAIEARVIAHLAGEDWREEVFRRGGDLYCASASRMFGVPVEKHGINSHLRQKGKIAELALGYGGGTGALKAMGALELGLSEEELTGLVRAWRRANPNITALWWDVDLAARAAIRNRFIRESHGIRFIGRKGMLQILLPSGRSLCYLMPRIGENRFGGDSIVYQGVGTTRNWEEIETYGPKLVENIVQAIARDLLANAMKNLPDCRIVAHVHDELIIECREDTSLDTICEKMAQAPAWMPGILLRADGYLCDFYRKD